MRPPYLALYMTLYLALPLALPLAMTACVSNEPAPPGTPLADAAPAALAAPAQPYAPLASSRPQERSEVAAAPRPVPLPLPLRRELRTTRVPAFVVRDEESLAAVVENLRLTTGLPLVVAPVAEQAVVDAGVVFDFELTNPIRVMDLLNMIERQSGDEVRWTIRHEAVIFTTPDRAAGAKVLGVYDIRSLTFARTDFIGPRIDRLRLLDELEDDDGGGPFGNLGEKVRQLAPEEVMDSVVENVAPGTWEEDGVSIDLGEGFLIVVHTPQVQAQVRRFLAKIGNF